ncbi:MAG TPA: hypothetical protein VF391_16080 [Dermatophilaceae bacterium]
MDDAGAWVVSSCADLGLAVIVPGRQVHDRPWSHVVAYDLRYADRAHSRVWFKRNGIGTRHEPALILALGSLVPDLDPEVLAVDTGHAWSLTRDAGPTWRSAFGVADQWHLWEEILQRYAAAQLSLAARRASLKATGIPERSPATLPGQAAEVVAELTGLGAGSGGLSTAGAEALAARLPAYGQGCRDLDATGIPWSIQHDDLHSNNICGPGAGKDPATGSAPGSRIIDWGDASVGHPFGTLLATLRSLAFHGDCDVDRSPGPTGPRCLSGAVHDVRTTAGADHPG